MFTPNTLWFAWLQVKWQQDTSMNFFDKLNEIELNRKENLFSSEKLSGNIGCMTIVKWMFLYPILLPYNLIVFII